VKDKATCCLILHFIVLFKSEGQDKGGRMSGILGRKNEVDTLEEMLASNRPEFLAIYGRRRVGKTFLIREFFKNKNIVFFKVTGMKDGAMSEQIKNFTKQISETFYNNAPLESKKSWDATFELLTSAIQNVAKNKKIVLFFDELPWMATSKSKLLQNLDYYWNQYWSDNKKIKLVVCGSSSAWIINKIVENKGGLHNRITRQIHLSPFKLNETRDFLKNKKINLSDTQILAIYMVTGGVPYYLEHIDKGKSATQIIERLAFSKKSLLLEEFDKLFSSLFEKPETYIEILRIIAESRYGIGQEELLKRLEKSLKGKGGLERLKALEQADFIISFKPHLHKKRGIYYRLIDEYTLFYFSWIEPIKQTLQERSLEKGNWQELQNTPAWNTWSGYAFEAVCYKHLSEIRKKLEISPTAIADSWRYVPIKVEDERGAQIDLLFDRRDNAITLCEIKYSNKPYVLVKDYVEDLKRKIEIFKKRTRTKKQIFLAFITVDRIKNNFYAEDMIDGCVELEDLFS
jgi:AAA+ ATPase superfamily predicted ATPase